MYSFAASVLQSTARGLLTLLLLTLIVHHLQFFCRMVEHLLNSVVVALLLNKNRRFDLISWNIFIWIFRH